MKNPEFRPGFKKGRLVLAGVLALITTTGVIAARSQRISLEQDGVVQTINCPHLQVLDRNVKVPLLRFPNSKEPDQSEVMLTRINDFFVGLLDKNPEGYQIDAIRPFDAAPRTTRDGVFSFFRTAQGMEINYVRKVKGIGPFRAIISEKGIEVLTEEVPASGRVESFIKSFFEENGCEKDHILVDPASPNRLYVEWVHSLNDYNFGGERKPISAK